MTQTASTTSQDITQPNQVPSLALVPKKGKTNAKGKATGSTTGTTTKKPSDDKDKQNDNNLKMLIVMMLAAIAEVQSTTTQNEMKLMVKNATMKKSISTAAIAEAEDMIKECIKIIKEIQKQSKHKFWNKVLGWAIDIVGCLLSAFFGPEMLMAAIAITVLTRTGVIDKMATFIVKQMHIKSKKWQMIVKGVIEVTICIAISMGVGAAAGGVKAATASAAKEGEEAGAESAANQASKARSVITKFTAIQLICLSGGLQNILQGTLEVCGVSKQTAMIIAQVVTMLTMLAADVLLFYKDPAAAELLKCKGGTTVKYIVKGGVLASIGLGTAQAANSIVTGETGLDLAKLQKEYAQQNATLILLQELNKPNTDHSDTAIDKIQQYNESYKAMYDGMNSYRLPFEVVAQDLLA